MTAPQNISRLLGGLPADVLTFARAAGARAQEKGTFAALVGGIVRDLYLGRPLPPDADVIVEPPSVPVAEALAKEFGAELTRHPRFHTFRLDLPSGRKFDVVTAREETYSAPAALPDVTPSTFEKDLSRRDFTINAMLCRLGDREGQVMDPFGGHSDLERKLIRALHPKSFEDDPTRLFRAARFAGRLDFQIDPETLGWIRASLEGGFVGRLSPVRRRHELELILKEESPGAAISLLAEWGALRAFDPAWDSSVRTGLEQVPAAASSETRFLERLAAVFGRNGAVEAEKAMSRLQFEKAVKRDVLSRLRK